MLPSPGSSDSDSYPSSSTAYSPSPTPTPQCSPFALPPPLDLSPRLVALNLDPPAPAITPLLPPYAYPSYTPYHSYPHAYFPTALGLPPPYQPDYLAPSALAGINPYLLGGYTMLTSLLNPITPTTYPYHVTPFNLTPALQPAPAPQITIAGGAAGSTPATTGLGFIFNASTSSSAPEVAGAGSIGANFVPGASVGASATTTPQQPTATPLWPFTPAAAATPVAPAPPQVPVLPVISPAAAPSISAASASPLELPVGAGAAAQTSAPITPRRRPTTRAASTPTPAGPSRSHPYTRTFSLPSLPSSSSSAGSLLPALPITTTANPFMLLQDVERTTRRCDAKPSRFKPTKEQYDLLVMVYERDNNPDGPTRVALCHRLGGNVSPKTLQVWFQNRRSKARAKDRMLEHRRGEAALKHAETGALRQLVCDNDVHLVPITQVFVAGWHRLLTAPDPKHSHLPANYSADLGLALALGGPAPCLHIYSVLQGQRVCITLPLNASITDLSAGEFIGRAKGAAACETDAKSVQFSFPAGTAAFSMWNGAEWCRTADFTDDGCVSRGGECQIVGPNMHITAVTGRIQSLLATQSSSGLALLPPLGQASRQPTRSAAIDLLVEPVPSSAEPAHSTYHATNHAAHAAHFANQPAATTHSALSAQPSAHPMGLLPSAYRPVPSLGNQVYGFSSIPATHRPSPLSAAASLAAAGAADTASAHATTPHHPWGGNLGYVWHGLAPTWSHAGPGLGMPIGASATPAAGATVARSALPSFDTAAAAVAYSGGDTVGGTAAAAAAAGNVNDAALMTVTVDSPSASPSLATLNGSPSVSPLTELGSSSGYSSTGCESSQ
ncbi:Paired mesoderm homeobox protein 2 [Vanrija pseudolonga]|uniref:Paired mesoderm homeobox protein 2 n=1 Tax=Vanrija pseudolonga TaxID=143232 RepID=A0AAF0Y4Q6_9TREE|nr:Paired mesoderm homeobox protein 2 [Vanrija pseudolonga]